MKPEYSLFLSDLAHIINAERIVTDPLRTLALGTDASFYRLIPQAVVMVETEQEVIDLLLLAGKHKVHVTFRAAGTSLSGQAVTDGILVRLAPTWNGMEVLEEGGKLRVQPGVIGAHANRKLAPFQRKIGPDPASINACKIGGIVANNASGMCCGTAQNTYQTIESMRLVLADGTVLDTADPESRTAFMANKPELIEALVSLHQQVSSNAELKARIQKKFSIKNTTGYSLNALVDYHDPIDILMHLMVGSEGTLGFVSEVVYRTVEEHAHKASALLMFADIEKTSHAVTALATSPVAAVELIDRAGLRSVQDKPGMPDYMASLSDDVAALLVEVRATTEHELEHKLADVLAALSDFDTLHGKAFTTDPATCQLYWNIRKGMFPAVGAMREKGTTVIIEDVAFPVESLAPAVLELQSLFKKYHYDEAIIFGHALAGNLHFVFTQNFTDPAEIQRYADFMDEVCVLVVGRYDGSLKAEHGTGRNMAPFVELEWGAQAYDLMWQIKHALDPDMRLNPGVILTRNLRAHIEDLKPIPEAHDLIDKCIECGFCEPVCPSKNLTLTPRQRIVVMRELSRLDRAGHDISSDPRFREVQAEYQYQGIDTCAADGLCSLACPVDINTGDLSRYLRSERNQRYQGRANWVAGHFDTIANTTRTGLKLVDITRGVIGDKALASVSKVASAVSMKALPLWHDAMPQASHSAKPIAPAVADADLVYFPSCASRNMGPAKQDQDQRSLQQVTLALAAKAGVTLTQLPDQQSFCCGMPLESKGMFEQADAMRDQLNQALLTISDNGRIPVLIDTSPCVFRMSQQLDERIQLLDPVNFANQYLVPQLDIKPVDDAVAVHVTCSTTKQGLGNELIALARHCSTQVVVPEDITCCGFAGDKGFMVPELNASALAPLKRQVKDCKEGVSTSRTCEIGLARHGEIPYHSLFYLLDRVSSAKAAVAS
ncbi:FAD-binding and (Fe-S)-binding domain-containing protein [Oceanobacter sp. 4_MG-2023]|uniref:FAD-binding and (Fe-S)-binding domain-containing protein n=1 Tax=Oceanobacter sp. 4_MG-2023 TaxID=3062623 RepID=UPI0027362ACB|nr:FAD-binding and (Fe-S)-binding domain-containing protein [Oceanobacter sp. 4_MG-2023]MDP2547265.1 FAD-binding and (Fe-S)-binding domain-containing protein [Oceanobacter sp. 4_MG-2023]